MSVGEGREKPKADGWRGVQASKTPEGNLRQSPPSFEKGIAGYCSLCRLDLLGGAGHFLVLRVYSCASRISMTNR